MLVTLCRSHQSSTKDHLKLLLTQLKQLPLVIFGRCQFAKLNTYLFFLCNPLKFPSILQLVVVRADLNGHLKALKDYFLLAKGDFFQVSNIQCS